MKTLLNYWLAGALTILGAILIIFIVKYCVPILYIILQSILILVIVPLIVGTIDAGLLLLFIKLRKARKNL